MNRYDKLMIDLKGLRAYVAGIPSAPYPGGLELISEVERVIKSYCEPWTCPSCRYTVKIPDNHKQPNVCQKCGDHGMIAYSYLEQHRMSWQLTKLAKCAEKYANIWFFGRFAKKTLANLGNVPMPKYKSSLPTIK